MTFGAPLAFLSKQVRYVWNASTSEFNKIVTTLGDPMLAGISIGGTDAAPSFENLTSRVGKFMSILQVSTRHEHAITIECDGRQGYWPRDTWTQPTDVTFNTPGGATELSMPISIASVSSVERVHQPLSHVSFVDTCELDENEVREFAITTDDLEFDYDFLVFRMLPDGLNVDSRQGNRTFIVASTGMSNWSNVDDPIEWYQYRPRWYRYVSPSGSPLTIAGLTVIQPPAFRSQFSHSLTLRFRRSQIHSPTAYTITLEVMSVTNTVLETFSIDIPTDDTIDENVWSMPLNQNNIYFRFTVPGNAKFEMQAYTERTHAP
jgi:hypothetical protein